MLIDARLCRSLMPEQLLPNAMPVLERLESSMILPVFGLWLGLCL